MIGIESRREAYRLDTLLTVGKGWTRSRCVASGITSEIQPAKSGWFAPMGGTGGRKRNDDYAPLCNRIHQVNLVIEGKVVQTFTQELDDPLVAYLLELLRLSSG
jgi:hypothetical protein